jgi:hypothetical protein
MGGIESEGDATMNDTGIIQDQEICSENSIFQKGAVVNRIFREINLQDNTKVVETMSGIDQNDEGKPEDPSWWTEFVNYPESE